MQGVNIIIEKISVIGIIVLIGFFAAKFGYISNKSKGYISAIVVRITLPVLIISSLLQQDLTADMITNALIVVAISIPTMLMGLVVALGIHKLFKLEQSIKALYICMSTFGNVVFLGYPLIQALYGGEGLFYAIIYSIINDGFVYSLGIYLLSGKSGAKNLKKLINPNTISFAVALILLSFGVKLNDVFKDSLTSLGQCTTPLAMLFIGISLAEVPLKNVFKGAGKYIIIAQKMLIAPLMLILILMPFNISPLVVSVIVLQLAMPMQTIFSVLSFEYGAPSDFAVETIFISMVVSVFSLPLIYTALNFLN